MQAPLLRQTLSCYPCCGQTVQPTLVSGQPQVMVATLGFNADAGGAGAEQAGVHNLASIISNLKTLRQVRVNLHGCHTPCILSKAARVPGWSDDLLADL